MPQITISIIAPNHDLDQQILSFELPLSFTLADLKGLVHDDVQVPPTSQHYFLNNTPVSGDEKTVEELGIKDGDMLAMLVRQPQSQQQSQQQQQNAMGSQRQARNGGPGGRRGGPQSQQEIENARQSILQNPAAMAQVREQRPALADAINDPARFTEVWNEMIREDEGREQERMEQMRLLNEDPFNVDAQRKIEEMIRQQSVQENLQFAYEHNPEVFGRVTMLYIPVEVNSHPVKAFVDSGAQTTIMSPACAQTTGIMRLIDTRYSGVAKGVGTANILGRVHSAAIKIGNATMGCSFTVMEGKDVDLLLGLDMLKRFQAVIDLRENKLVFGDGNEVLFLGEADIPKSVEEAAEPAVKGPNGTEIGTVSGTVRPAGSAAAAAAAAAASSSGGEGSSFRGSGQKLGATVGNGKAPATSSNAPAQSTRPSASSSNADGAAPARPSYPKESVDQLISLGFSQQQALAALDACDGNVEYAAGLLFQN